MERGPIPPHERTWRHPSELAAQERLALRAAVAPRTTRATALAAGTFGLIVVAALVLVVTPPHRGAPMAISATTIPFDDLGSEAVGAGAVPPSLGLELDDTDVISSAIGITGPSSTNEPTVTTIALGDRAMVTSTAISSSTVTTVTTLIVSDSTISSTTIAAVLFALATPVGDGSYALVTTKSIGGQQSGTVWFRLPSGATATGEIIFEHNDTAVVALPSAHTPHAIATRTPGHAEMVTVMSDTPFDMTFGDIASADVPEGTPVVDGEGGLVGLCSKSDDGTTTFIDVADVGGDIGDMPTATDPAPTDVSTTLGSPPAS